MDADAKSFNDVQADRRARSDAISSALADVDKGQHGLRHHRIVNTIEAVDGVAVHSVWWCWDCGRPEAAADQVPTPSDMYDDHPALGFCGYTAKTPGPWWEKPDLDVTRI